jgi:hypothetical protein
MAPTDSDPPPIGNGEESVVVLNRWEIKQSGDPRPWPKTPSQSSAGNTVNPMPTGLGRSGPGNAIRDSSVLIPLSEPRHRLSMAPTDSDPPPIGNGEESVVVLNRWEIKQRGEPRPSPQTPSQSSAGNCVNPMPTRPGRRGPSRTKCLSRRSAGGGMVKTGGDMRGWLIP